MTNRKAPHSVAQIGGHGTIFVFRAQTRRNKQGVPTDKGPYRRCVIHTEKGPLQTIWGPYRQLRAPTDKEPIQTRGPYRPGAPTYAVQFLQIRVQTKDPDMIYMQYSKGLLQTRGPCKQGLQHYIQPKSPIQACREPLKTKAHVDKGPLQKVALRDERPLRTRSSYRQEASTAKDSYRHCVLHTTRALTDNMGPL